MNFTGCQSGNASSSRSLSSCDIASLVRRPSFWRNSVARWVHPLVGRVCALPHVVISCFRDSDFEDLATGLLLALGPSCGTLSRPKLDNRVTIYYSSRVNWKHFCSSSPEPFCGCISIEGLYRYILYITTTTTTQPEMYLQYMFRYKSTTIPQGQSDGHVFGSYITLEHLISSMLPPICRIPTACSNCKRHSAETISWNVFINVLFVCLFNDASLTRR